LETPEDQQHFLQCKGNPAQEEALQKMIKTLTGKDAHPSGTSLAACIESHLNNPTTEVQLPLDTFESRYKEAINDAIDHQKQIGWQHLIRDFCTLLASPRIPQTYQRWQIGYAKWTTPHPYIPLGGSQVRPCHLARP
jgi:hypothetical protein